MQRRRRPSMLVRHEEIHSLIDDLGPRGGRARLSSLVQAIEDHCAAEARSAPRRPRTALGAAEEEERWLLMTVAGRLLAPPHDRETRKVRLRNLRAVFVEHCTRTERR